MERVMHRDGVLPSSFLGSMISQVLCESPVRCVLKDPMDKRRLWTTATGVSSTSMVQIFRGEKSGGLWSGGGGGGGGDTLPTGIYSSSKTEIMENRNQMLDLYELNSNILLWEIC